MFKKVFKYSIIGILTVSFLILVLSGVDQLKSEKTSIDSTQVRGRTNLPSFTICPWSDPDQKVSYDQVLTVLGNGTKVPLNFTATFIGKNLLDPEQLKTEFNLTWNDVWSVNCKFYALSKYCAPCVTFKAPENVSLTDIEWLQITLKKPENGSGVATQFFVEIHEADQSLVLQNKIDFSRSGYFRLKKGYEGIVVRNARQAYKTKLNLKKSPCDEQNGLKMEEMMMQKITEEIQCNLPWSKYKSENYQDCKTDGQMKAYFDFAANIDETTSSKMPPSNCVEKLWRISDYYTDYANEKKNDSMINLMLLAIDDTVDLEMELKQYGFNDFIGDFGGYLGLLLGGSIPSLLSFIDQYFSRFMEKLKICTK